jgi:hypothetical protein
MTLGESPVETEMSSNSVELRPHQPGPAPRFASETWALLTLALMGLLTLAWVCFFAWINARAVGLL